MTDNVFISLCVVGVGVVVIMGFLAWAIWENNVGGAKVEASIDRCISRANKMMAEK